LKSVKTEVRGLCLDIHGKMIPDLASVQRTQAMSYFNHQWSVEKMPLSIGQIKALFQPWIKYDFLVYLLRWSMT